MPIINKQFAVTLPSDGFLEGGDPSAKVVDTQVDIARELSEYYGKNMRQGNTYFIAGVQATMRAGNNEYDTGLSSLVQFHYCPSTKHTRQAWMDAFKIWAKQKRLRASAIGRGNPYDDLEFAYSTSFDNANTSKLFQGGLADSDQDTMVLYGNSSEGDDVFALEDYYTQLNQPKPPSRYSAGLEIVKDKKFDDFWPAPRTFSCTADASANAGQVKIEIPLIEDLDGVALGASSMDGSIEELPELAPALCGLLNVQAWVIPDDTWIQFQDNAILHVTIWVKKWKPIFPQRKSRSMRSRRSSRGRFFRSSRKRS